MTYDSKAHSLQGGPAIRQRGFFIGRAGPAGMRHNVVLSWQGTRPGAIVTDLPSNKLLEEVRRARSAQLGDRHHRSKYSTT